MTKILIDEAVVRQALECLDGVWRGDYNGNAEEAITDLRQALADAEQPAPAQDDRNKLATWMMEFAFATGHGDTMEDLLDALGTEIVDTVDAAREDEREACARLCEEDGLLWGKRYADAIRARGET